MIQEHFIFFPQKLDKDYKYDLGNNDKEVFFPTQDGEIINGILFKKKDSKKIILYFHGNSGSLNVWQHIADDFKNIPADLFIIDYRGYGKSSGKISEIGFYNDAIASYNFLLNNGYLDYQIIVYGRSLGSGVAVELATQKKAGSLILESPYTNMLDLANKLMPYFFPSLYLSYSFDNISKVEKLSIPVLLLHGDRDEVIPYQHSQLLFEKILSQKKLVLIKNGLHNDLINFIEFEKAILEFII